MCTKQASYQDFLTGCPDQVVVNALLLADSEYYWEITDSHGNKYNQVFTTDSNGYGIIDMSALPEGFCNPYQSGFEIRVKTTLDSCDYVDLIMMQKFGCIHVKNSNGNTDKSWIGCSIDQLSLVPAFTSYRFQFTGAVGQTQFPRTGETYDMDGNILDEAEIKAILSQAKQIVVFVETGVLQVGAAANEYQISESGVITFGQTVEDRVVTIIVFK